VLKIVVSHFIILFFHITLYSQSNMKNDIDFLTDKIKNSYAGYADKIKNDNFFQLVKKVKQSNSKDTFALLSKITSFFNDLHLVLYDYNLETHTDSNKCRTDKHKVEKYFENKVIKKDVYEGYWISEYSNCIIGIKKITNFPVSYNAYVIETKTKIIPGFIILKLIKGNKGYFNTDYIEESLGYRIFLKSKFKDSNTLLVNSYGKWKKIKNYQPGMLTSKAEFDYTPSLKIIDEKNIVLKLPDFGGYNVIYTDSIIQANLKAITSSTTLIIDIRNNMGGTIRNYLPLLKFIYTKPIIHSGVNQLCSEDLIEDYKADIKKFTSTGDTFKVNKYKKQLDSVTQFKGKFRYIPADTIANKLPVLGYPKNIALLVNNNCLSAAELMILDFKQSDKVKVFGETTGGAVDYLDALVMNLPSKKYTLFIATSKRAFLSEDDKYDNKGIKPDVEIPDNVDNWIDFVKIFYERK
jgi:hypothetical protein